MEDTSCEVCGEDDGTVIVSQDPKKIAGFKMKFCSKHDRYERDASGMAYDSDPPTRIVW